MSTCFTRSDGLLTLPISPPRDHFQLRAGKMEVRNSLQRRRVGSYLTIYLVPSVDMFIILWIELNVSDNS
jgi:hypothetical protein